MGMDRVKIQQVVYGSKNLRIGFRADAYEDGCQFDHDHSRWNLGLFWYSRKIKPALNKDRVDAKRFRTELRV